MRWLFVALTPALLLGQSSAPTGSISGRFVAPGGHPLHGYLYLTSYSQASAPRKIYTGSDDGTFHFNGLPAGVYSLCTRGTLDQAPSIEEPFLDSCAWPAFAQTVRLKAGQTITGLNVQGQPGVRLHVRVNAGPLAALTPLLNPNAVDPNLELHVRGADQMVHVMPVVSTDSAGRDHALVVPHDTYLLLRAKSKTLSITSAAGKLTAPDQQIFLKSGVLPNKITLQVAKLP